MPAGQRLGADDQPALHVDDRLVVDLDAPIDRRAEILAELQPVEQVAAHRRGEHLVLRLALRLAKYMARSASASIVCGPTPPAARRCRCWRAAQPSCPRARAVAARPRARASRRPPAAPASIPSSRTANSSPPRRATVSSGRTDGDQSLGHGHQEGVAGLVPERVVDPLEVVEVEVQHAVEPL